jgi:hypothetical protein
MGGVGWHSLGLVEHSAVCRSSQAKVPAAWQRTPGVWFGLPGQALTVLQPVSSCNSFDTWRYGPVIRVTDSFVMRPKSR